MCIYCKQQIPAFLNKMKYTGRMGVFKLSVYQLEQKCGTKHDPNVLFCCFDLSIKMKITKMWVIFVTFDKSSYESDG